jgi:hypothetical protein
MYRLEVPLFCLILSIILSLPCSAQTVDRGVRDNYPIITSEGKVYLGTPSGLRYYDAAEDDWMVTMLPGEVDGNAVGLLGLHQDILWAGTRGGAANADIRLGDWVLYDTTAGLGDNSIRALAFEEDYAWVGTSSGASRFDLLSQEWESYGEEHGFMGGVNDIAVDGMTIWFATDRGVVEYDPEFEAWRSHDEAPEPMSGRLERILVASQYIWFFGKEGVGSFNRELRSWTLYTAEEGLKTYIPNDLALEGDSICMVSDSGVTIYDPESDRWDDFQEERFLPSKEVRSLVMNGEEIWFGTAEGVARYDRKTKGWRIYSKAEGLSSPGVMRLHLYGDILIAATESAIDYLKLSEDRWYSEEISPLEVKKPRVFSITEEEGARFQLSPHLGMALKGRSTYEVETQDAEPTTETESRNDLRLTANLPGERGAYGFYDDTDPQGLQYGMKYRGRDEDLLREASLGDLRSDPGRVELIRPLGVYGGGVKLERDLKSGESNDQSIRFAGSAGERTTGFETDLFVGTNRKHAVDVQDVDYMRRTFYRLDTTSTRLPLIPKTERIWVDDGIEETNTPNTSEDMMIGGVLGEFELLLPGEDYFIDYQEGIAQFATTIQSTDLMAVEYEHSGSGGGRWEGVIQDSTIEGFELPNHYSLGGAEIIPYSLSMQILDLNNIEQPLSDFGFDGDLDGLIDAELVDFQKGVLHSNNLKPFPDTVYSPSNPTHLYTIHVEYKTRSSLFTLTHRNLIRESEIVLVDGLPLKRGDDYLLDYTSGYLLVLNEELVGERGEVEVTYEYWTEPGANFGSAGFEAEPVENLILGMRGIQFEEELSDTSSQNINMFNASSELRSKLGDFRVRIPLEIAQNTGPAGEGRAYRTQALVSSERLRLQGLYEAWDEEFRTLVPRRSKLGSLIDRYLISSEYYIKTYLPARVSWKSQSSAPDSTEPGGKERNLLGSMLLTREGYPSLVLSSGLNTTETPTYSSDRRTVSGNFEYELSGGIGLGIPLRSLRATSYLSRSWEDIETNQDSTEKSIYDAALLKLRTSPVKDVELSSSYRYRLNRISIADPGQFDPIHGFKELILLSHIDRVKGLSLYLRGEGSISEDFLPERSSVRDLSLDRIKEWGMEIYPGMWTHNLHLLSFEMDWSSSWRGYLPTIERNLSLHEALWKEFSGEEVISHTSLLRQGVTGKLRPGKVFNLSSGYQRLTEERGELETILETITHIYPSQLEVRPRFRSVLTTEVNVENEKTIGGMKRVRTLPTFRWEERWRENLLSKVTLLYSHEKTREGAIETISTSVTPGLGLTLRYDKLSIFGGVDLSEDISVTSLKTSTWDGETSNVIYSSQLRVEVRPVKVMKVRTRYGVTYETDPSLAGSDNVSSTFSLRLSALF